MSDHFDPFQDRSSRNTRNLASRALIHALDAMNPDHLELVISELLGQNPPPEFQSYLNDRLRRYREAFAMIESRGITEKIFQGLALWNRGLFFEAHERLETVWQESSGEYREAIKGLIQAAGVFLLMEQGRSSSAERLRAKARDLLEKHGHLLPVDVADLLSALEEGHHQAPKLGA